MGPAIQPVLLLFLVAAPAVFSMPPPDFSATCSYSLGDLNLATFLETGLNSPTSLCRGQGKSILWTRFTMILEHFAFELRRINRRPDLLPNITLGYVAMDTCFSPWSTVAHFTNLVNSTNTELFMEGKKTDSVPCTKLSFESHHIVGVVGPTLTIQGQHTSSLAGVYKIPLLSTIALGYDLSDKTRFKYFSRLLGSSGLEIEAALDFFQYHGWTYISFVYLENSWGEGAAKVIQRSVKRRGMCLAVFEMYPYVATDDDIQEIARKLAAKPTARVVLMFLWRDHINNMVSAIEAHSNFQPIYFIFCCRPLKSLQRKDGFIIDNPLNADHKKGFLLSGPLKSLQWKDGFIVHNPLNADPAFVSYMRSVHPSPNGRGNRWLPELWELIFGCKWEPEKTAGQQDPKSCSQYENMTMPDSYQFGIETLNMEAAEAYAHALHALISDHCPEAFSGAYSSSQIYSCVRKQDLLSYLRMVDIEGVNGRLAFDKNGDRRAAILITQYSRRNQVHSWTVVGHYEERNLSLSVYRDHIDWQPFTLTHSVLPESVCSQPCEKKEYPVILTEVRCCWECRQCRDNEKLDENKTGCNTCPVLTWPDNEFAITCDIIDPAYVNISDVFGKVLLVVAIIGILLGLGTLLWFIKYKNDKLVKASSRELSAFILFGITLAFTTIILFLTKPSQVICQFRLAGFHVTVALIFGPLFVKSNRIYRIFAAGKKGTKAPGLIGNRIQIAFSSGIVILQIMITVLMAIIIQSDPEYRMPVVTERFVELNCTLPLGALLPGLIFNLMLLSMCAVYGYLTRKLPENFNESWYIFVSVSTTLFLWMVFIPAYFTAFYASHQVVLLCCCLVFNAVITLVCLFWTKIYVILTKDNEELNVSKINSSSISNTGN